MEEHRSLSLLSLFRFASRQDKALLSVATVLAVVGGTIVPLLLLSLGDLHGAMVRMGMESGGQLCQNNFKWDPDTIRIAKRDFGINLTAIKWQDITNILGYVRNKLNLTHARIGGRNSYPKELLEHIREPFLEESASICLHMGWLVLAQLVTLYATTALAGMAAASQGCRIRAAFFRSLMHQDIAWFDAQHQENFAVRIIGSLDRIQEGLGEKATLTVLNFATSVTCFLTAFVNGWKLTLIVMALMPFICLTAAVISKYQVTFTHRGMKAYNAAGTVAEEAFSGIRTVMAYGGQNKELDRYCRGLRGAHLWGVRLAVSMGAGYGLVWILSFSSFGVGLWFGTRMVFASRCTAHVFNSSNLVIVILSILNSALALAQLAENFEAFSVAKASAYKIFEIIDRIPHINSRCRSGQRLKDFSGNITFANLHFQYPLRPDVPVINGLSFNVNSGETVALVGASGCGKSTLIQLLQRFYDPVYGEILLDGNNIRDLNVGWLRSQMGLVSQEPALFETTIAENILLGNPDAGEGAVVQAAIAAHAHDFIVKLPKQYNTMVGEKGTQLSGGQKQRIAIARALVRNPKILLLDEATSALDSVSEYAVQAALDQVRKGRTTLIIAHRLSTIRNADRIVFIRNGRVAEIGTHTELLARESLYYQFVISQGTLGKGSPAESDQSFDEAEPPCFSPSAHRSSQREHGHVRRKSIKDTILSILPIEEVKEKRRRALSSYRFRLLKLCFPEWWLIALGSLSSLVLGVSFPRFAVIFGDNIQALLIPTLDQAIGTLNQNSINLFVIAISSSISSFLQNVFFGIAGERMTIRLRKKIFLSMLSQELSWYDDPRNSTGTLCSRLSSDPASVRLATVDRLCSLTQAISTMLFCVYIVFGIHTKMALVAVSLLPIIALTTYLNTKVFGTHHLMERLAEEGSSETAVEAIRSIRTVASLHRQDTFIDKFISSMKKPYTSVNTFCHLKGLMYGISQSCMALSCVLVLHYGTVKIVDGEIDFNDLFSTVQGVIIFSLVITNVLIKAPDASKARAAAERIFQIIERKPAIMSSHARSPTSTVRGNITFRNVHFSYPLRPETKVLKGMDLFVKAGQTVALVGTSGCGKSTCIALLQRFYDCKRGEVLIDGVNVHEYEVGWLRSQMGLVSQEPVLFGVSLAENIAYGASGGKFVAEDFIEAARTANIHNFICALPEGYQTQVGSRDIRLSGGEKQRVAIARALVRNPRILLLDEATSALDVESELIVQEALERAREGRTCIVIAHRLSTIQNADQIVVIHDGAVVEKGKHYELLAKKGFYYELYRIQSSGQ